MAAPRKYPPELKERALRLWRSEQPRRPIAHVAHELGIHPEAMRTWIRQEEADRGERTDRPTTAEQEELRRLRKENLELRRDGIHTSRKRVARLMAVHCLQGAFLRKRWRCSTRQNPKATPAPDLVNRNFKVDAPNRLRIDTGLAVYFCDPHSPGGADPTRTL